MQPTTDPGESHRADPAAEHPPGNDTAEALLHLRNEVDGLRRSLVTRSMIDMALGMIMAIEGCSLTDAWQILEQSSLRSNTELRTAAQRLVGEQDRPAPPRRIRAMPLSSFRTAPAQND
ncbi:ANTAR domain-containing protein [Streptomyces sp. NPDC057757]|uniref:ANTAR domain-containing protein n=1 Tax=Streptomyces sp. NPDC057757 TaxID=3346241 RepID=UPI0036751456